MTSTQERWPAERFYWARLDASALPKEPTPTQLGFLLERFLPEPIESVHAVFVPVGPGRFIAIAARRTDLDQIEPGVHSLRPASMPPFIEDDIDLDAVELLTGPYLPPDARRARRRALLAPIGALALILTCALIHTSRSRSALRELDSQLSSQIQAATEMALGYTPATSSIPSELRLEAALRELRRTRTSPIEGQASASPELQLASILTAWPRAHALQVETVISTESQTSIIGIARSASEVQELARDLDSATDAPIGSPSIRATADGIRFDLQIKSTPEESLR